MLEETHIKIAEKIGRELGLNNREVSLLKNGSTLPDYWGNFPHHHGKENEIKNGILFSRKLFLEGDDECFIELGKTLHYIQDRWTLRPRTSDKHTRWEKRINNVPFFNENEIAEIAEYIQEASIPSKAIRDYLDFIQILKSIEEQSSESWLYIFRKTDLFSRETQEFFGGIGYGALASALKLALINRPSTWSTPLIDFVFAYKISLEVSRLVLLNVSDMHPKAYWDNVNKFPMFEENESLSSWDCVFFRFKEIEKIRRCWNCIFLDKGFLDFICKLKRKISNEGKPCDRWLPYLDSSNNISVNEIYISEKEKERRRRALKCIWSLFLFVTAIPSELSSQIILIFFALIPWWKQILKLLKKLISR